MEIPGEVTLALNLSGCPNRCPGCHSPHLQGEVGEALDEGLLGQLLEEYGGAVTCVAFMGGDAEPEEVQRLARVVRERELKTAWYSGKDSLPSFFNRTDFDFVKVGPWVEELGGLDSPTTNQRLYAIEGGEMRDITDRFNRKS